MKTLVAGGAGFIGSHLVDALLAKGHTVICIDDFSLGTQENISHLESNPNFNLYKFDLCNLETLKKTFETEQPEHVFHLAANSDIQASGNNPIVEYKNTYTTTFNLLECMRLYGVNKLFFSSTSAIYGEKEGFSMTENSSLPEPISYYGGAKLGSEGMIYAYTYMNDFHSLVFRFPNVIGSRLTHGVIFDFIKRLKADSRCLRILGDGKQAKPYMHVSDLVDGIMTLKDVPQGVTTYNIGVDSLTSVTKIADMITAHMGLKGIPYEYTGGRGGWKGDVPVFKYNLEKIHKTGWHASYTSDEAVALTIKEVLSCEL